MSADLTLKIDLQLIKRAQEYAALHQQSLSQLVERYLQSLTEEKEPRVSPLVESLTGVLPNGSVNNQSQEYRDYLHKKYS